MTSRKFPNILCESHLWYHESCYVCKLLIEVWRWELAWKQQCRARGKVSDITYQPLIIRRLCQGGLTAIHTCHETITTFLMWISQKMPRNFPAFSRTDDDSGFANIIHATGKRFSDLDDWKLWQHVLACLSCVYVFEKQVAVLPHSPSVSIVTLSLCYCL